jgi:hypothetical protein
VPPKIGTFQVRGPQRGLGCFQGEADLVGQGWRQTKLRSGSSLKWVGTCKHPSRPCQCAFRPVDGCLDRCVVDSAACVT